jgi:hypothetical protein
MKYIILVIFVLVFCTASVNAQKVYKTSYKSNEDKTIIDLAKQKQVVYNTPNKHYVVIIDYTKSIDDVRLFVVDIEKSTIVLQSIVSHARNSGLMFATNYSNEFNTHKSSPGAYQTKGTYPGQYGYSMVLKGLESINNNAEKRQIIFHSTGFNSDGKIIDKKRIMHSKYSWGCFATSEDINKKIIDMVKNGSLVYVKR